MMTHCTSFPGSRPGGNREFSHLWLSRKSDCDSVRERKSPVGTVSPREKYVRVIISLPGGQFDNAPNRRAFLFPTRENGMRFFAVGDLQSCACVCSLGKDLQVFSPWVR